MRIAILAAASLPLAACAGYSDPAETPSDQPPQASSGACDAEAAQYHIGHDATEAMGAAILKDSGAETLRWGPPNSAWTMDYRANRVNVKYDEAMKITEITCG